MDGDDYRPAFNENLCPACKDPDLPDIIEVTHCEACGVRL